MDVSDDQLIEEVRRRGFKIKNAEIQKKEWVGLTKEELAEISEFHFHGALSGREFYDDIEAKLKEKNT
jgi:DNA-binding winged helix-turn-helix (wHTH) protein